MRVIAGEAKGRPLKAVPGTGTRPTTDKVKEAMFSMIGPFFDGGRVLDLFAGTGGLGIEALSRGMDEAVFIDLDVRSIEVIRRNVEVTGFKANAEIYKNDAERALRLLQRRELQFSLVFLDPPYRLKNADKLMSELARRNLLTANAVLVVEHGADCSYPPEFNGFTQTRRASYGETTVTIYHYEKPADGQEDKGHEPADTY